MCILIIDIMICAFECVRVGPIAVRYCLALMRTRLCPLARTRHASTRTDARLHADANSRPCARARRAPTALPITERAVIHLPGLGPACGPIVHAAARTPARGRARAAAGLSPGLSAAAALTRPPFPGPLPSLLESCENRAPPVLES